MFAAKDTLLTRPSGGYQISRSVRLRSSATAYLSRTPAGASNRSTWTWSGWVKRGVLDATQNTLFASTTGVTDATYFQMAFSTVNPDCLLINSYNITSLGMQTAAVFRDPAAWYHIVFALDTTQATASNRMKLYVNGVQQTSFLTYINYPALNSTFAINSAAAHNIGASNATSPFDGYMTEINFVDGQALTPSSFGENNAVTGVWQPKKYAGTYGTNGFYLNFSDNSAATAATIGKDYSGNGNNWTPNNISVTAGVTYDSMIDVPTLYADGGNGRGNYCVLNPLNKGTAASSSNANLSYSCGANSTITGSIGITSGKWYWEIQTPTAKCLVGIINSSATLNTYIGINVNGWGYYGTNGQKYNNGPTAYGATFTTTDIIGVAFDADNGTLVFYKNNASQGTAFTGLTSGPYFVAVSDDTTGGATGNFNFGQRPFSYTPPTGYVALNTQNLPIPTISNGANYMAATTYTGTGSALTIANTVGSASFQPDWVWVKSRSAATDHGIYDSVRGVQKQIESNNTAAETTETTGLTAFGSTGFTVGALAQMNTSAATYVGWQWNAGGSTVTNTSGSISAQVRANPTAGFSVVTYTGTGANATVGHGLGVAPSMVIVKVRNAVDGWFVYNKEIGNTKYLRLNTSDAASTFNLWQNTSPTSSVFSIATDPTVNFSGYTYVAYCFAAVAGYSAFGSYTGNGSTDGTFVYTGFRPRFLIIKRTDAAQNWALKDTSRSPYNVSSESLFAQLSDAEYSNSSNYVDILSNGFKIRTTDTGYGASGGTYIYYAVAENPFKNSLAR